MCPLCGRVCVLLLVCATQVVGSPPSTVLGVVLVKNSGPLWRAEEWRRWLCAYRLMKLTAAGFAVAW